MMDDTMTTKDFERIDRLERDYMQLEQLLHKMVQLMTDQGVEVNKQNNWARDIITKQMELIKGYHAN